MIRGLGDDNRVAWSAFWGVLMGGFVAGAIAWLVAASTKGTGLHAWPVAFVLGGLAVGCLYLAVAPLLRWWPWPKPKPIQVVPRLLTPPLIRSLSSSDLPSIRGQRAWGNPMFPADIEMVWNQPEVTSNPRRVLFPIIRITNHSKDRVVNLSFTVLHRFPQPTVLEGMNWMPMRTVEQPKGLPEPLNLGAQNSAKFRDQAFDWPIDDLTLLPSGRVGLDGCDIEVEDHLSGQKLCFTDRHPPQGAQIPRSRRGE